MMGISFAVSVYIIESSTELFTIYLPNGGIFTANIGAWLPFLSPFPSFGSDPLQGFTFNKLNKHKNWNQEMNKQAKIW